MLENEKFVADILLSAIADTGGTDRSSAISRYQDLIEAVNMRKRVLVTGWNELNSLDEMDGNEPEEVETQWWAAELDQYGNPTLFDGAHGSREDAAKSMQLIKAVTKRTGKLAIVKVEVEK